MSKKAKIIVSISGIVLVMLILLGLTYAYFLTRIQGNTNDKSISVTTANLELTYGDNSAEILGKDLTLIPSDTEIGTKTFTVTNNGNDTSYVVVIENVSITKASDGSTTTFESNDFRYTLTCIKSDGTSCDGVSTQSVFPINGGVLVGNSIKEGDVHTYTFKMWYIDTGIDQSNDMGKSLQARLNITDIRSMTNPYSANTNSLSYNIIHNAITGANGTTLMSTPLTTPAKATSGWAYETDKGTEATSESSISIDTTYQGYYWTYGIGYTINESTGKFTLTGVSTCKYNDGTCHETLVGKYIVSTKASSNSSSTDTAKTTTNKSNIYKVTTAPASSTSTITMKAKKISPIPYSTEKVLSVTSDDYGTSYYYRGNVTDNYLAFNGYCWRIVRIEGDGSIKVTLAATKTCSSITDSDTGTAFIGKGNYGYTQGKVTNSSGQLSTNDILVADYVNGQTNNTNSMKYKLEEWLTSSGIDTSKLKADNWCLGNTTDPYKNSGTLLTSTVNDLMYNGTKFYYNTYVRLYGIYGNGQTANATLRCDGKNYKTHKSYIGALTADEVVFAGGKPGPGASNYYLTANASDIWWTLSPCFFDDRYDNAINVYDTGLTSYAYAFGDNSLRPAVSLASGTVITGGNGTQTNPYVVG